MNLPVKRIAGAIVITLAAATIGYGLGSAGAVSAAPDIPTETIEAPPTHSIRVLYSLDHGQADKELIALIDNAQSHIYFAIYTFTLDSIADALVAAKKRGIDVRGVVDSEQSRSSYSKPIIAKLVAAGIPVRTERHASGNGIMHIKALVTDSAYAIGSYNWTNSANTINDEIIEIGTDPAVVRLYANLLRRLFETYKGTSAASAADVVLGGTYDYTEALNHIGEYASVRGTLVKTYTSSKGTVFLDFCKDYKTCPFSGVIFADDAQAFGDLSRLEGTDITLTGTISSYQGRAEIKLSSPSQISR